VTELRDTIARNISKLRTEAGLTQLALAEKLNYSDKAVSKWERAESVPDIFMLKRIADLFRVSVDYLLEADHTASDVKRLMDKKISQRNKNIVTCLSVGLVWFVATAIFVLQLIFFPDVLYPEWMTFIYAIPISSIVAIVFNSLWGKKKINYVIISVLVWSIILAIFLSFITIVKINIWQTFLIGVPAQIIICLWSGITSRKKP